MTNQGSNYVRIFDTTLRDGEQSPNVALNAAEKLLLAEALANLGVDVIEAGFPAASAGDHQAVTVIAERVGRSDHRRPPVICGLARANREDIDRCAAALSAASRPRIHTFVATSAIHRKHKLRMSCSEVIERVHSMVAYAAEHCDDVEFSPEDAGRTEPGFLYEVVAAAIASGATTVNIPDTVGYTLPQEFGALIAGIIQNVPRVEDVVISVHCHDDLGMATANTLAGIAAGARQAEVTMNGIGERAGNTALEEVVMALATRRELFDLQTGIETAQLAGVSRLVSETTGMVVPPNKAVVGDNAFAHEAGIHQDGVLKHRETYEIMAPQTVGGETKLVLGKHSGRHAFARRLEKLGYRLARPDLDRAFIHFKHLADTKRGLVDADLVALVEMLAPPPLQVGLGS